MASNTYQKSTPGGFSSKREIATTSGGPWAPAGTTPIAFSWTDSLDGVKLTNWRKIILDGGDATTNMTASSRMVENVDGFQLIKARSKSTGGITGRSSSGFIYSGAGFSAAPFTSVISDEAFRDASSKFYSRAYSAQTQLMSGVVIGELRETLKMVHGRGRSMVDLLGNWSTAVRRLKKTKSLLKDLADLHLEAMFGWRPLANDIAGGLAAFRDPRLEITRVSASATKSTSLSEVVTPIGAGPLLYDQRLTQFTEVVVRIRGGVKVAVQGHGRNMQAYGLSVQSWVPSIYELIPWSFFVDYFTDLGNVINAISFPKGDIAYGSTSTSKKIVNLQVCSGARINAPPSGWDIIETQDLPHVARFTKKEVVRVRGAPAIPRPTVRLPTSWLKWANIAALTVTGFSRNTRLRL